MAMSMRDGKKNSFRVEVSTECSAIRGVAMLSVVLKVRGWMSSTNSPVDAAPVTRPWPWRRLTAATSTQQGSSSSTSHNAPLHPLIR
jgi:hypothetical protein